MIKSHNSTNQSAKKQHQKKQYSNSYRTLLTKKRENKPEIYFLNLVTHSPSQKYVSQLEGPVLVICFKFSRIFSGLHIHGPDRRFSIKVLGLGRTHNCQIYQEVCYQSTHKSLKV